MDAFGWRLYRGYRVLVVGALVLFAMVAVASLVRPESAIDRWWGVAYLVIVAWNADWFGFRLVCRLQVADGVLHWESALHAGQVPVGEAVAIRQGALGMP